MLNTADTAKHQSDRISVLVVEDDSLTLHLLVDRLQGMLPNSQIGTARSMTAALSSLKTTNYESIVLDIGLPDAQFLEAVHKIRAAAPHGCLTILSGNLFEELDDYYNAGADHIVSKNANPDKILQNLKEILASRESRRTLLLAPSHNNLTPAQKSFLFHLADPHLDKLETIASKLGITFNTAKRHRQNIFRLFSVKSRSELIKRIADSADPKELCE